MKKNLFSLLLFIGITVSSSAQYTPVSWTLVVHSVGKPVKGGYYFAGACKGHEEEGGVLPNPSNPFSFYFCNIFDYTTNVMGCADGLAFNPTTSVCDWKANVMPYWPNFPWDEY